MENANAAPDPTPSPTPGPATDPRQIAGWFAGRLPDTWFTGAPEVKASDDQILVSGTLPASGGPVDPSPEAVKGYEAGRISRFREETRGERIYIARQAEHEYTTPVTWAVKLGSTEQTFTKGGVGWNRQGDGGEPNVTIGRRRFGPFGRRARHGRPDGVVNPQVF